MVVCVAGNLQRIAELNGLPRPEPGTLMSQLRESLHMKDAAITNVYPAKLRRQLAEAIFSLDLGFKEFIQALDKDQSSSLIARGKVFERAGHSMQSRVLLVKRHGNC